MTYTPVVEEFYEDQLSDLCRALVTEQFVPSAEEMVTIERSMSRRESEKYEFTNPAGENVKVLVEDTGLTAYRLYNPGKAVSVHVQNLFASLR